MKDDKGVINAEQLQIKQETSSSDDKIPFNPDEWEEVPFSQLNTTKGATTMKEQSVSPSKMKGGKNEQSSKFGQTDIIEQQTASSMSFNISAAIPPFPPQQVFLMEYGKKFTKYKKYKQFEQHFHEKYERNMYFDPTDQIFITPDGFTFKATPGNSVGTNLLLEPSSKSLIGFSNLSFNLELKTMNKILQEQIDYQSNQISEMSNDVNLSGINNKKNGTNSSELQGRAGEEYLKNPINASSAAAAQTTRNKSNNNLESIYDWIEKEEKKGKLKKKRFKKQNKPRPVTSKDPSTLKEGNSSIQQSSLLSSQSQATAKKSRSTPINYFIRKLEK